MLGHFDPALILRRYYANVRDFKNTDILFGDSEVLKLNNTKVVAGIWAVPGAGRRYLATNV